MENTKINYDREADVLYVSLGQSQNVTGVELADNVLLRLDVGQAPNQPPKAVGLTFISFAKMMKAHQDSPVIVSLANLRQLPAELWQAVLTVVTMAPVSDYLAVNLSLSPQAPPLPELLRI
ncbi:MAG: DUF2283 domain-containing protein [Caldilineaceae bacterium]|nr:DUF2283 domain-containing protein [Caldilineaceae bacterium]